MSWIMRSAEPRLGETLDSLQRALEFAANSGQSRLGRTICENPPPVLEFLLAKFAYLRVSLQKICGIHGQAVLLITTTNF